MDALDTTKRQNHCGTPPNILGRNRPSDLALGDHSEELHAPRASPLDPVLFDWYDYHLYQFEIDGVRFEAPDEEAEGEDSTKATLSKVVTSAGQVFYYTYHLGDDWLHLIEVLDVSVRADPGWIPHLVDGARRGPMEDSGGVPGYERLIAAVQTPYEDLEAEDQAFVDCQASTRSPPTTYARLHFGDFRT